MAEPESKSEAENQTESELPVVESPSLSPGAEAPVVTTGEPVVPLPAPRRLRRRHKRLALLAASMAMAASIGGIIGAVAAGDIWSNPRADTIAKQAMQERQAMQHAIAQLSDRVATLKTDVDKANKATQSKIAKVEKLALHREPAKAEPASSPETTGSIPQQPAKAEVPVPRPAPRIAAAESRPVLVPGWSIRDARGGFVYVEGRGDIYQVVPGARLPGVGTVQSIERHDGHWVVVTPRGLIVSMRDRRYFE